MGNTTIKEGFYPNFNVLAGNNTQINLLGIYSAAPELLKERLEVLKYYSFYRGKADYPEDLYSEFTQGQSWEVNDELDYTPSSDIRNHTKKLIQKQARFMFGNPPTFLFKPLNKKDKDKAEAKRMIIDQILEDVNFISKTFKAFIDCTIGKRVLMMIVANPGKPIDIRYYPMDTFTFEVDSNDYTKLSQVIIAYQEADTADKNANEQIWYRWKYYMKNGQCWLTYGIYNGNAEPIEPEKDMPTGLDEIPARVISNGGLTGDIYGTSDVRELMDLQNAYNKTTSDFRDSLRFRMFEQPVFIDADSDSLKNIKIAPNAIIDLKSDIAIEGAKASAQMLSSNFTFTEAVKFYLENIKQDMYEIMDQPRPEQLSNVPSAKALRFMFYDLIARCEEKWLDWEPAFKWMIKFIIKCVDKFNLYPELNAKEILKAPTNIIIEHNYPIPEDEETKKDIAIKEVQANVRSHKSYIRDFSNIEDEDGEWQEILQEQTDIINASSDQFNAKVNDELNMDTNPIDSNSKEGDGNNGNAGDNRSEM